MVVKVLGPLDTGTEPLSPRERTLLSALVVRAGTTVHPAELADAWWGESPPRTWEQQVRNSVARIRARLGKQSIETLGVEYRLGIDPDAIDAVRFERLVSAARGHRLHGEHDRAVDAYRRALAFWRGAPLQDVADWEPGVVEALRLVEIRTSAEEELLDARLAAGEHRTLIPDAERLLRAEPLREDRWSILALANYRADRQADALALLRSARERLADELGIEPGPRLANLELAMLRRDPALDAPAPSAVTDERCPYPGLRAFGPEDAVFFFGRDADVDTVLERVRPGAVVAITGASGTGKSSLLLAGVLPRLRERGRSVELIHPGGGILAEVRRAAERCDVLAIDQAEEIDGAPPQDFAEFGDIARAFLDGGGAVVLTVRSDGLDRIRTLPRIGDDIGRGVYLLGPLSDAAYRRAVEEPAHAAGLRIEPGLVELAVRDAGDRSATLPHLSHAMQETWNRREGATLTVDGYRLAGGIPGAIAQSAEGAFRALSPDDQEVCRSLMMRLLDRAADGTTMRRRVPAAPLLADAARRRVLETLTRARIIAVDGEAVTVAHEAVATAWPRLDAWLEADAEGARTLRAVEAAAATWDAGGRPDDDLLRGARLHSALDWRDASHPDLTRREDELLTASVAHEQRELRSLRERAARETRRNRLLGAALVGAAALLVVAVTAGSIAVVRGQESAASAENARIEATVATSRALRGNDREAAALLAAEAFRRWPDDGRVRSALLGTITSAGGLLDTHRTPDADRHALTMIPGTATALRVRDSETESALEVVDVATGDVLRALPVDLTALDRWRSNYRDVAVSDDGRVALVQTPLLADPADPQSCCWNGLTFVELSTGTVLAGSQVLRNRTSVTIDLGPDGSAAYFAHPITGDLIVVEARSGLVRASDPGAFADFTGEAGRYNAIAVLDEDRVATATADTIRIYDRRSLALVRSIPLGVAAAGTALLPDGAGGLFSFGQAGAAHVHPTTGVVGWTRPQRPAEACLNALLMPDGAPLCSALGAVSVLDPGSGYPVGIAFATQVDDAMRLSPIDDRTILLSTDRNTVWMRWRADGSGAGARQVIDGLNAVSGPTADGRLILTAPAAGGGMAVWDLAAGEPTGIAADGLTLLTDDVVEHFTEGGGYGLQNLVTGEKYPYRIPGLPTEFGLYDGGWGRLAFLAFGDQVVTFDPATGEPVGEPLALDDARFDDVASVSASSDQKLAAVTWYDSAVGETETGVFRIADGELLVRGLHRRDAALISTADDIIAVSDKTAQRIDMTTLEPVSTLSRADGGSRMLTESLDGRTLLNVGWDDSLRLYDLTRDIPLGDAIDGGPHPPEGAGGYLAPDGQTLYVNTATGVLAWDLRPAAQARTACALAGRELSAEEWSTYFPGEAKVDTCAMLTKAGAAG